MDKNIYEKACDLIGKELAPIEHEDDLEKAVSVFQILIDDGHFAADDEIYQYMTRAGKDNGMDFLALKIQHIYETVRATLKPTPGYGWDKEWIKDQLYN